MFFCDDIIFSDGLHRLKKNFLELVMNDIKVCFCEREQFLRNKISAYFTNADFDAFVCSDDDFFDRLDTFDVAVLDMNVNRFREIYNEVKDDGAKIILTYDDMPEQTALLNVLKPNAVIARPYSLNDLAALVRSLLPIPEKYRLTSSTKSIDEKLSNIFIRAGIPPHIKGYQYLRTAVKLAINQPDIVNSITKKLYPTVAEYYSTTPSKVERAIRHAIEVAWSRGKIENINAIFGIKIYSKGDKPTNGELIALIADKMVIEMM